MKPREQIIPLCRSDFLQDFSIALGLQLKPIRHSEKSIMAEVDTSEYQDATLERLCVWIHTWSYTRVSLTLWENGMVWVAVALLPTGNNKKFELSFYPECESFTPEAIVEALRGTISVSTRLCYNESPLPTLRKIWRHTGEVETEGKLELTEG